MTVGLGYGSSTLFDADGDNVATACKTTPGTLISMEVTNINTSDAFVQFFDAATTGVTVGTTTPKFAIQVPAGDGTLRGGCDMTFGPEGIVFKTAITYACTTTANGAGDPSTGLVVNLFYT